MRLVTPERWYMAFWAVVWFVTMVALYVVIRLGVAAALLDTLKENPS